MTYDDFKSKIAAVLMSAAGPLTWTQIRTAAALPQLFPNNQWVHRMERDIALLRTRATDGTIQWQLASKGGDGDPTTPQTARKLRPRSRRKQSAVE